MPLGGGGKKASCISLLCHCANKDTSAKKNSLPLLGTEPQSVGSCACILVTILTELLSVSTTNTCNTLMSN